MDVRDGFGRTWRGGIGRALLLCMPILFLSAGCTASGYPRFVKFVSDGRHILYQDNSHSRVYVHDLRSRTRQVYEGWGASFDARTNRLVIESAVKKGVFSWSLLTMADGGGRIEDLPPLRIGEQWPRVVLTFAEREDEITAYVYPHTYAMKPSSSFTLIVGQASWNQSPIPEAAAEKPYYAWNTVMPMGIREGGYTFAPIFDPPGGSVEQHYGPNVEQVMEHSGPVYHIQSADGRWIITIRDPEDEWRRMTLTEVSTGRKIVLLEKNDAGQDVLNGIGQAFGGVISILLGHPNI